MEPILNFIGTISLWIWILILGEFCLLVLVLYLIQKYTTQRFEKRLNCVLLDPSLVESEIHENYGTKSLLRKSKFIEKFAEKKDMKIIKIIDMDRLWTEQLKRSRNKRNFKRVLKFAPEEGLFTCFLIDKIC